MSRPEFLPTDEKLVSYFLRSKILGLPLPDSESKFLIELDMYGTSGGTSSSTTTLAAGVHDLFGSDDSDHLPWQPFAVDFPSGRKLPGRILYVFTRLNSNNAAENSSCGGGVAPSIKREVPGFGTWVETNKTSGISMRDRTTTTRGVVVGYSRFFHFKSSSTASTNGHQLVVPGLWFMIEIHIYPAALGISTTSRDGLMDWVVCKIIKCDEIDDKNVRATTDVGKYCGDQRDNIFYTNCVVQQEVALMVIDSGSSSNLISAHLVAKLGLPTTPLPVPREARWIHNDQRVTVDRQATVHFVIAFELPLTKLE
ncbi:OLC1v1038823C1 [Oldenlandia corymbosa var. corymbosa]|uniref:OLC1v1038823C1 n=1 Tax=Oldenlandia corymbosa var. corymbosa TaxID=529605 RepID=A0AAV1D4E2_OLDCO|nr:OLC1v1038823C1 [Oldenlandia corymbosa var. corymbosa]